jgi:hypothetical protein
MYEPDHQRAREAETAFQHDVRQTAGTGGTAVEIAEQTAKRLG